MIVKRRNSPFQRRFLPLYLMLVLPILWYVLFHYVPMFGIQIAFRNYMPSKGIWHSDFAGLRHFRRFFSSFYFNRILTNTIGINLYMLFAGFPIPIIFALALFDIKGRKYRKTLQNVTYMPHFLSAVVVVSILQLLLDTQTGLLNRMLESFGLSAVPFLTDPKLFKHVYVWSGIWAHTGWDAIIYVAVLTSIDPQLYEAATIDGASRFRKHLSVSLPGIAPTIVILLILRTGQIMNIGYEKILLMQNDLNLSASDVISTFVYRHGILGSDPSFSAAVGLFNSVANFALLLAANTISRKVSQTSLF